MKPINYYFWVKETEQHDPELQIIKASSLKEAKKEFSGLHPEDVKNIDFITSDNSIVDLQ